MLVIKLTVFWLGTVIQLTGAQTTEQLDKVEGDNIILACSLTGTFTFPLWLGPPSLSPYTILNDATGQINPSAPAANRLSYVSNNRDLLLSNASQTDSGDYQCSYTGLGDKKITLRVTEKIITTAAPTPAPTPGPFPIWIIIVIIVCCLLSGGIAAGVFMYYVDKDWNKIFIRDCHKTPPLVWLLCIVIVGFGILIVFLIKHFSGILNSKNKKTSPSGSKTEKSGKPQPPHDEVKQDLVSGETKHTVHIEEGSAVHTKKNQPLKLKKLDEAGSEKHHLSGRPLPQIQTEEKNKN